MSQRARFLSLCLAWAPAIASASGRFVEIPVADLKITRLSSDGAYAVGEIGSNAGYRWNAHTGTGESMPALGDALGINPAGTVSGSIAENGGSGDGGRDLGAYAPLGAAPVLLSPTLSTNSIGYGIADDGTVVGMSFADGFAGTTVAFRWNPAQGMVGLPSPRPQNHARANDVSADGRVVIGWNDRDDGFRAGVLWQDGVAVDVADATGTLAGEVLDVSANGQFSVGCFYTLQATNQSGAWRRDATGTLLLIPDMECAYAVSNDGKTIVGSSGFFDTPSFAARIWREGIGTVPLTSYLSENGIAVPAGWQFDGGALASLSADAHTLAGWGTGPLGVQSYVVHIDTADVLFVDGFDRPSGHSSASGSAKAD